jgi:hypothetical protein
MKALRIVELTIVWLKIPEIASTNKTMRINLYLTAIYRRMVLLRKILTLKNDDGKFLELN